MFHLDFLPGITLEVSRLTLHNLGANILQALIGYSKLEIYLNLHKDSSAAITSGQVIFNTSEGVIIKLNFVSGSFKCNSTDQLDERSIVVIKSELI